MTLESHPAAGALAAAVILAMAALAGPFVLAAQRGPIATHGHAGSAVMAGQARALPE